jgi:large subunit ribosomal protein L7/L12
MSIENIVEEIKKLSLVEVNELVKKLEEEFGVSAATVVAGPAAGGAAPVEEAKTEFTIVLKEIGPNKIPVIKLAREITGLGLSDAKTLVESAPATIKENVPVEDAKAYEEKFKEAGATVELK